MARKDLLTVKETQTALSCGRTLIYKLINDGTLTKVKLGGSTRITAASIKKLVEGAAV
ncbi:helix-turn-helix domain-containing protein [Shimia thalassica]|uniref:helix-turn-helix domain-containing protein n=1 Tax=Shimia thalassica TaxID=1715693 RepID=UPI0026E2E485|nr:helix-turn-helix domain-containing protein [Shimia thalassica]